MAGDRLSRLQGVGVSGGLLVLEATSFSSRLLGLALLAELPACTALLISPCRSVHTFGMRFALDLLFLDADWSVIRRVDFVAPRRVVRCRTARAVLETRAGEAASFVAALERGAIALGSPRTA